MRVRVLADRGLDVSEIPVTLTDVALNLARMSRELARLTYDLADVEKSWVAADLDLTLAYAKEYLKSGVEEENGRPPSVATREARTNIAVHDLRVKAETLKVRVGIVRKDIDAVKTRIECARSSGALIRAEQDMERIK